MPPKKRKLWATRLLPSLPYKRHESQAAAYRHVQHLATEHAAGSLRADISRVTVFVDERDGRGWQRFEVLDLADLVRHRAPSEKE